jgi:GH15 family glucan-1,4-alpha-glucosidase
MTNSSSFNTFDFDSAIQWHLDQVRKLRAPTGLFTASASDVTTGYNKAWLRDIYFMTLGFKYTGEMDVVKDAAKALLQILGKHKEKITWAVHNKPFETWQYIHARYNPDTFEEYWEEWGNKQNDAVGEVLYLIADCETSGHIVVETDEERELVQLLVNYLNAIEYWNDADSGIWEENQEVRASSIGAVVRALMCASQLPYVTIPEGMIEKGRDALRALLPRETSNRFCDLALLTLIFPFEVTTLEETKVILSNVEYFLTRDLGVIRYRNDGYYNNNPDGYSEEAEWSMGHAWLCIIYANMGNVEKATEYFWKASKTINKDGLIPELWYSHTTKSNDNIPLGWAESMYVVALVAMRQLLEKPGTGL